MNIHVLQFTALQAWDGESLLLFYYQQTPKLFKSSVVSTSTYYSAPVLVAIALIEYGMDAISAVTFIRERRYTQYTILLF